MTRPLEGLRVLDLTRLLPGGFCTLLLADLGADVIKIEEPGKGDYMRWTPPFDASGTSAALLALCRNKRSVTLNLKSAEGPNVLKRLAKDADVLVESFRPGVLQRLGVGFDELSKKNPRLVWCAITGYGQDGPYRDRAGHDVNYLGYAGVLSITGPRGGPPVIPGVQIADVGAGALMSAVGILAALQERSTTGRGRFVDVSMTDGAAAWLSIHAQIYDFDRAMPGASTMRLNGGFACYRIYRCSDGRYLTVGALEPQFFRALCEAIGAPELIERQFDESAQDALIESMSAIFETRTRDDWIASLADLDACVGPVNDFAEAFADPHLRARGTITKSETGHETLGNPIRLRGDETTYGPAPAIGEHTDDVLTEAGYSKEEIAALRESGAL